MRTAFEDLCAILARYLSSVTAQSLLGRAFSEAGVSRDRLTESDLDALLPHLDSGIRLFLDPDQQRALREDLLSYGRDRALRDDGEILSIRREDDISTARLRARTLCSDSRASTGCVQKVVSIVSELAQNIVTHTPGGSIELSVRRLDRGRSIAIIAIDGGDGILELAAILEGDGGTRTNRGLAGVKRLADRFEAHTGPHGTRIEAEVWL